MANEYNLKTADQGRPDDLDRLEKLQELHQEAEGLHYRIENTLTDEITKGKLDLLNQTLDEVDTEKFIQQVADHSNDEMDVLRTVKNSIINMNTYSRIAAKNGGVLPLTLYLISERYSILIEKAQTIDYLIDHVFYKLPREYAQAVADYSTIGYSDIIKDIVYEISKELASNLTLKEIADRHKMHPVHLARKFKAETGMTFITYINEQRIALAMYYFHLDKYKLGQIVKLAGFNSHSYFTKVFKKSQGITPTKYKRLVLKAE